MHRLHSLSCSLAFFSCLVVAGCSSSGTGSGPGRTVERFHRAVESGDVTAITNFLHPDIVSALGQERLESLMRLKSDEFSRREGLQSIEILSEEIDGTTAKVKVRVTLGNDETAVSDMALTQDDGRWFLRRLGGRPSYR